MSGQVPTMPVSPSEAGEMFVALDRHARRCRRLLATARRGGDELEIALRTVHLNLAERLLARVAALYPAPPT